jgi:hypothetical protein
VSFLCCSCVWAACSRLVTPPTTTCYSSTCPPQQDLPPQPLPRLPTFLYWQEPLGKLGTTHVGVFSVLFVWRLCRAGSLGTLSPLQSKPSVCIPEGAHGHPHPASPQLPRSLVRIGCLEPTSGVPFIGCLCVRAACWRLRTWPQIACHPSLPPSTEHCLKLRKVTHFLALCCAPTLLNLACPIATKLAAWTAPAVCR